MKIMQKTWSQQAVSGILVVVLLISNTMFFTSPAYGAEPTVSVDEAAYVNLDYYGRITSVNIVKGCSLNGITQFEDYGKYMSVSNMSGYDQPITGPESVKWNLTHTDTNKRFYYACKVPNNAIEFPWNIDVSYKLNGVPSSAEVLAGASGVVEINVKVTPNPKAKPYYKNNMMLQVATYIDMEDTYSLDAPGSQLQSAGTYKAVVFAALPGEEDTFTMRIGTKSFETKGITMTMIPGTLRALEDLKSIKEAKDTLYDSFSTIHTSMNDALNTMDSMKKGLSELQSGATGMEDARSAFSGGKGQMHEYADTVLSDLSAGNKQLKKILPYFVTEQNMIKEMRHDINDIVEALDDLEDPLDESKSSISSMKRDLEELDSLLGKLNNQIETALTTAGAVASTPFEGAEVQGSANIAGVLAQYSANLSSLLTEMQNIGTTTKEVINITQDLVDETDDLNHTMNAYYQDTLDLIEDCRELTTLLSQNIDSTIIFLNYTKSLLQTSGNLFDNASKISLQGLSDVLDRSIHGLGTIPAMRNANDTIKVTIDKEFNKFEEENKFLNLDATSKLVSFTSDNNPAPTSIQVILRTEEISLDNKDNNHSDLETKKEDIGFIGRIKNLFNKILNLFHISSCFLNI